MFLFRSSNGVELPPTANMPRPSSLPAVSQRGLLGRAIAKRFRRNEARKKKVKLLQYLKTQYQIKVIQERRTRRQLGSLEDRIKSLERCLNYRARFDFSGFFQRHQQRRDQSAEGRDITVHDMQVIEIFV
jgi:hypothetical protein